MEATVLSRRTFCVVFLLGVYVHIEIGADSERTRSTPSGPTTPNEPQFLLTNCIGATESGCILAAAAAAGCVSRQFLLAGRKSFPYSAM